MIDLDKYTNSELLAVRDFLLEAFCDIAEVRDEIIDLMKERPCGTWRMRRRDATQALRLCNWMVTGIEEHLKETL